ncbi:hypothetical protein TNCV_19781 [Trichonephila clavipes]|nr:hypothetical protein TNCV_19781 [Trichonephila clavipes]
MESDIVVVVSRTGHAVDEEDAAEIDKLLEAVETVSITELGETGEDIVGFGSDINSDNNFNGGQTILVIFSSVCEELLTVMDHSSGSASTQRGRVSRAFRHRKFSFSPCRSLRFPLCRSSPSE